MEEIDKYSYYFEVQIREMCDCCPLGCEECEGGFKYSWIPIDKFLRMAGHQQTITILSDPRLQSKKKRKKGESK